MDTEEDGSRFIASFFTSSPAPIVGFDRDNLVTAWNPAAERLFGWRADEMLGQSYALVPEEGEPQYRAAVDRVFEGTLVPEYRCRRRRKDGSLIDVSIALAPIRAAEGEIVGALAIFNDITEKVIANNQIERLNRVITAFRGVNQLIVRERDPGRLLQGICACLVKNKEYRSAWIALGEGSGGYALRAQVGLGGVAPALEEALLEDALPTCVTAALETSGAHLVEDRERTCAGCPLEPVYPRSEAIVARLEHDGELLGVLGLSLPQNLSISSEETAFVVEVAHDVAFALRSLEIEAENRKVAAELAQRERDLAERIKELGCLYGIAELVERPGITLEEILEGAVRSIPASWRYSEITCARITLEERQFTTDNFRQTDWRQACDITVYDEKVGSVEVCYLEERPEVDEGPFLAEERKLITAVCARLGRTVERLRGTDALRESERRLSTLISNLPGMVYRCENDTSWTMEYVSEGCSKLTGYGPEELTGGEASVAYGRLIYPEDREAVWDDVQAAVRAKEPFRLVYRITDAGGEERYLMEQGRGVYDEGGELQSIEGFITEITALKRAEEEARLKSEQLIQADKMVALGTLVSGVGHEINNPNNFIMLNVPLLKGMWEDAIPIMETSFEEDGDIRLRGIPFAKAREMIPELLDDIMEGSWRIKRIVGELKDYARPQTAETSEPVDVNEAARSAIVLCNTFINQRTQNFSTDLADDLPRINGSSQRLEQVVINLLQNACEALESNKNAVSIQTLWDREREGIEIVVEDEGVGISEEHLTQVTNPFYTTKREAGGTGLGLSITKRIVENHGGTITFESTPGSGTVFSVFLPRDADNPGGTNR